MGADYSIFVDHDLVFGNGEELVAELEERLLCKIFLRKLIDNSYEKLPSLKEGWFIFTDNGDVNDEYNRKEHLELLKYNSQEQILDEFWVYRHAVEIWDSDDGINEYYYGNRLYGFNYLIGKRNLSVFSNTTKK